MKKPVNWAEPDMGEEEAEAAKEAVASNFIGGNGPRVKEFEKKFADKVGAKYAVAVTNGTAALILAMQALREQGLKLSFLVPTLTFYATGATAKEMGKLYFSDCNRETWNMDKVSENTANILVPVDVCGLPVDYDILKKSNKVILADSAESIGSLYKQKAIGSQATIHTFSLHASKVITTGEGGMVCTNSEELNTLLRAISNQGYENPPKYVYEHRHLGFNYRMSEVHAAIGLVQLGKLDKYVKARREKAAVYRDILGDLVGYQVIPKYATPNFFLFCILVDNNYNLCRDLEYNGINTKCMWTPLHQQQPLWSNASFPHAEYISKHALYLPIGNRLNEEDIKEIAHITRGLIKHG
jgi:perosamine synthetase